MALESISQFFIIIIICPCILPWLHPPVSKINKLFQTYLVIYLSEAIPESSNVSLERETLEH